MITGRIDVTKIAKDRLYYGKKGTYLNFVLIETPDSKFGADYMVKENVSAEDRKKGVKGAILGDAKIFAVKTEDEQAQNPAEKKEKLPF